MEFLELLKKNIERVTYFCILVYCAFTYTYYCTERKFCYIWHAMEIGYFNYQNFYFIKNCACENNDTSEWC